MSKIKIFFFVSLDFKNFSKDEKFKKKKKYLKCISFFKNAYDYIDI